MPTQSAVEDREPFCLLETVPAARELPRGLHFMAVLLVFGGGAVLALGDPFRLFRFGVHG